MSGPYHEGELAIQDAVREVYAGARVGRAIDRSVNPVAARFIEALSVAIVASVDGDGQPWCSALIGPRGSFAVPDPGIVTLGRQARAGAADPLYENLRHDRRVGLLFIDLSTRRRYRVNGRVEDPEADPLMVRVAEAYPNCPKYIQRRHLLVEPLGLPEQDDVEAGGQLTRAQQELLARADTLFLASANPRGELDASHRGGAAGFVSVLDERALWVPDYAGNSMFNTLGNLRLEPRAGLLFIDFDQGDSLQLAGAVEVDLGADTRSTGGTGRAWIFTVQASRQAPLGARLHAELLDHSPHNPPVDSVAAGPGPAKRPQTPARRHSYTSA